MAYLVARMQKMKSGNLIGIGNHNQRKTKNHSNPDIDSERSYLNYDLVERTKNYKTDIESFINQNKATKRAVRKDAVLIAEWIVTSSADFFKEMNSEEIKRFFQTVVDYYSDIFGNQNIRYAQVHLDESTPHMHLGIVPFDKNNKLTAKTVFNREMLLQIQDDLPKYLKFKGFDIERGERESKAKHLSVSDYKEVQKEIENEKAKLLEYRLGFEKFKENKQERFFDVKDIEVKESFLNKDKVILNKSDYEMLFATVQDKILSSVYLDTEYHFEKIELKQAKEVYQNLSDELQNEIGYREYVLTQKEKELEEQKRYNEKFAIENNVELGREVANLRNENQKYIHENSDLKKELHNKNSQISDLKEQNYQKETRIRELTNELVNVFDLLYSITMSIKTMFMEKFDYRLKVNQNAKDLIHGLLDLVGTYLKNMTYPNAEKIMNQKDYEKTDIMEYCEVKTRSQRAKEELAKYDDYERKREQQHFYERGL